MTSMDYATKNLMKPIYELIKLLINEEVVEPVFNENAEHWLISVRTMKPICGSIELKLLQPIKEEFPILNLEIYCEKSTEEMKLIFDKIIELIDNKVNKISTSENYICLTWNVNFNNEKEAEIDFVKISRYIPRIFLILKNLGLFQIKSKKEIIKATVYKLIRIKSEKIRKKSKSKLFLIRRDKPAQLTTVNSYYYYNLK